MYPNRVYKGPYQRQEMRRENTMANDMNWIQQYLGTLPELPPQISRNEIPPVHDTQITHASQVMGEAGVSQVADHHNTHNQVPPAAFYNQDQYNPIQPSQPTQPTVTVK